MALDKRLSAVASLVEKGCRIADIGTDHAYLPVFLVNEGICPSAIACDIRKAPLASAKEHIKVAHLQDKIEARLGNGLSPVSPDEVDTVVIAGMGGETVVAIMDDCPWNKDRSKHWILQPMTRGEILRKWLGENGFAVEKERLITDGRHLYPILSVRFTDAPAPPEWRYYAGFFDLEEGKPYRRHMAEHCRRKAMGLQKSDEEQARRLITIAQYIEQELL